MEELGRSTEENCYWVSIWQKSQFNPHSWSKSGWDVQDVFLLNACTD